MQDSLYHTFVVLVYTMDDLLLLSTSGGRVTIGLFWQHRTGALKCRRPGEYSYLTNPPGRDSRVLSSFVFESRVQRPISSTCFGSELEKIVPNGRLLSPQCNRRFGFQNASSIDALLDKDDVALEALLDDDDILQECKAQNTRLMDYFQRVDVLQKLLGYVSGNIEDDGADKFRSVFSPCLPSSHCGLTL